MPFSHHSHSGQFCTHAKDGELLLQCVDAAYRKHFKVFALTEHMPRPDQDLYPGEDEVVARLGFESLAAMFDAFLTEARRIRVLVETKDQSEGRWNGLKILIGFEAEWIRPENSMELDVIRSLSIRDGIDFFLGSVHHVKSIPIDYDREKYEAARSACGGSDKQLFEEYFDAQYAMVQHLKPRVVSHFDLIRLKSDLPNGDWRRMEAVWSRILRNLDFIVGYGGLLEINTAGLRKGLIEPYPKSEICEQWLQRGGNFVLSDDSHEVDHVGTHYRQAVSFLKAIGLKRVAYLERSGNGTLITRFMPLEEVESIIIENS